MIKIYEDTDRTTIKFYLDDIFWYFLVFYVDTRMFAYVWNEIERNTDFNLPRIYTEILRQIYLNWVFPECTYANVDAKSSID